MKRITFGSSAGIDSAFISQAAPDKLWQNKTEPARCNVGLIEGS
jgi:hypothetical protein